MSKGKRSMAARWNRSRGISTTHLESIQECFIRRNEVGTYTAHSIWRKHLRL